MNKEDVIYICMYTNTYIWNLERQYQRIYLQDSNGETDNKGQTYGHGVYRRVEIASCREQPERAHRTDSYPDLVSRSPRWQ